MEKNVFTPKSVVHEKPWGYENWILNEKKFPLLVKIIQADADLSLQIHPNDEFAHEFEGESNGKTECWLMLEAKPNAEIICGFDFSTQKFSESELVAMIESREIENRCLRQKVSAGDLIFIPAGTAHAILGGVRLLEIQQPSDLTYRISDWGRGRETHIEKSAKMIRRQVSSPKIFQKFSGEFSCENFSLTVGDVCDETRNFACENFLGIFCIDGEIRVNDEVLRRETLFVSTQNASISGRGKFIVFRPSLKI